MPRLGLPIVLLTVGLLSACAVPPPTAPNVMALPPPGKAFDVFQREDAYCRQTAAYQSGGAETAANAQNRGVNTAVIGAGLGAVAGGLIGAATGHFGAGAVIGAGTGLLAGSAIGSGQAAQGGRASQAQYDTIYTQCMYAHGNSVQSPPVAYPVAYPAPYPYYAPGIHMEYGYHRPWRRY